MGGWSEVLSLSRKREREAADERILGGGEFVERVLEETEQEARETLRWIKRVPDLDTLLRQIAHREGLEKEKIRGRSQRREAVKARKVFCQMAVKKSGYTGASVARYLGMTTPAVNRIVNVDEVVNLRGFDNQGI